MVKHGLCDSGWIRWASRRCYAVGPAGTNSGVKGRATARRLQLGLFRPEPVESSCRRRRRRLHRDHQAALVAFGRGQVHPAQANKQLTTFAVRAMDASAPTHAVSPFMVEVLKNRCLDAATVEGLGHYKATVATPRRRARL